MTIYLHPTAMTPERIQKLQDATGLTAFAGPHLVELKTTHTPRKAAHTQRTDSPAGGDAA